MMPCKDNLRNVVLRHAVLDNPVWDEFVSMFSRREVNKGDCLVVAGQPVRKVAFVCGGVFRAFYIDANGKEINQAFLLNNDFIVSRLRPASESLVNIQALEDSVLLVADMVGLYSLADRHHAIASLMFRITSAYFDKNQDREVKLRIQNAKENYRYFLEQHPNLIDRIPHYHIASYLHISATHLSRIRKVLATDDSSRLPM